MSENERSVEIGTLVADHRAQKRTLACLLAKARRYGSALQAVGSELKEGELSLETQADRLPACPAKADVQALLDDIRKAKDDLAATSRLLREAGIDLT